MNEPSPEAKQAAEEAWHRAVRSRRKPSWGCVIAEDMAFEMACDAADTATAKAREELDFIKTEHAILNARLHGEVHPKDNGDWHGMINIPKLREELEQLRQVLRENPPWKRPQLAHQPLDSARDKQPSDDEVGKQLEDYHRLISYFRDEGYSQYGFRGDSAGWTPAETAIKCLSEHNQQPSAPTADVEKWTDETVLALLGNPQHEDGWHLHPDQIRRVYEAHNLAIAAALTGEILRVKEGEENNQIKKGDK